MATKSLNIALVIDAVGNASRELKKIKGEVDKTATAASRLKAKFQQAGAAVSSIKSTIMSTVATLSKVAIGAGIFGKIAEDYETGLAKISTLTDMDLTGVENRWGAAFKQISRETGEGINTITEGAYQALSASVSQKDLAKFIGVATKTAVGGFTDVKTAVDGISSVMNSWGGNAKQIADIFLNTQNLGKTTVGEIADSIGKLAPTASQLGIKFEEVSAAIATLTATGSKTPEALTAIRATIIGFAKGTEQQKKALEKLGLSKEFTLDKIASIGYANTLKLLMDRIKKTTKTKQEMAQIAQDVFGRVEGLNALLGITSEKGFAKYNEALSVNAKNTDSVNKAFDKMNKARTFKKLKAEMQLLAIELGKELLPALRAIVKFTLPIIKSFVAWGKSNPELVKTIGGVAAALWGVSKVLGIIKPMLMLFGVGSPIGLGLIAIAGLVAVLGGKFEIVQKAIDGVLHRIYKLLGISQDPEEHKKTLATETGLEAGAFGPDKKQIDKAFDVGQKMREKATGKKWVKVGGGYIEVATDQQKAMASPALRDVNATSQVTAARKMHAQLKAQGLSAEEAQQAIVSGKAAQILNDNKKITINQNINVSGSSASPQAIQKAATDGTTGALKSFEEQQKESAHKKARIGD